MCEAKQHTFQVLTKRPKRMLEFLSRWDSMTRDFGPLYPHMWPQNHVWLGVSAESQKYADERIPLLLQTPAAVRWVSAEPLLGPIDLTDLPVPSSVTGYSEKSILETPYRFNVLTNQDDDHVYNRHPKINWLVAGSESGSGARPAHPDWFRGLRDQCKAAGVPFFFKQWGEWVSPDQFSSDGWDDLEMNSRGLSVYPDGRVTEMWGIQSDDSERVWKVGKKAAGRLLDGKEHNEYPALKAEVAA
jgi:protein gp37